MCLCSHRRKTRTSLTPDAVPTGSLDHRRCPGLAREERAAEKASRISGRPVEAVVPLTPNDFEAGGAWLRSSRNSVASPAAGGAISPSCTAHISTGTDGQRIRRKEIPFTIENMDVLDTPEVRDVLACLGAVDSAADAASLLRVAALPRFQIDPEKFRAAMRALPRDPQGQAAPLAVLLGQIEGGPAVLDTLRKVRESMDSTGAKTLATCDLLVTTFGFDRSSPPLRALLKFVGDWEAKPLTKTGGVGEFLEYLRYFREARGAVCLQSDEPDAVRLMTAHSAKGLEFPHVFIIRATSNSFPSSYKESLIRLPAGPP